MQFRAGSRNRRDDILEAAFHCGQSRSKRIPYYRKCKDLYLYGGDPSVITRANKIKPTVNAQSAFLYAPQSIKFWLGVPPQEDDPKTFDRLDPSADNLTLAWHDSKTGKKFGQAVTWGLVYGATILCILPRQRSDRSVEIKTYWVHPQDFGVYDDLQSEIDEQEAVSLRSYFHYPQIRRMLDLHPRRAEIERNLMMGAKQQSGFEGMISTPPGSTTFDIKPEFWKWYWQAFDYNATPTQPQWEIQDTYAFDDDLEDYRILTTSGDQVIWDRPMSHCNVPGLLPFVKVCADEHPEWFWGISLADDLAKLQMWYCQRMDDLDRLIGKYVDPPVALTGVGKSYEEVISQYRRKKGEMTLPANADIKSFQPQISPELFQFIEGIDSLMDEQAGHRPNMVGKGNQGGRGGEGVQALMRVAGAQMIRKSYETELNAQDVCQILLAYQRRYEDVHLIDEKGERFLMADFPEDIKTRVDGHSSSPIFSQDSFEVGYALHRSGAITDEMLLRMANIPQLDRARHDLRLIGFQKQLAEKIVQAQQNAKRSGKAA